MKEKVWPLTLTGAQTCTATCLRILSLICQCELIVTPLHWRPLSFDFRRRSRRRRKKSWLPLFPSMEHLPFHARPSLTCVAWLCCCQDAEAGRSLCVCSLFSPEGEERERERGDFSTSWTNKQQRARETKPGREHLPGALCLLTRHTTVCERTPPPHTHTLHSLEQHTVCNCRYVNTHTHTFNTFTVHYWNRHWTQGRDVREGGNFEGPQRHKETSL